VPGTPFAGAQYIIPASRKGNPPLSPSFTSLLVKDGINLVYSDAYGSGLSIIQKNNFAPRLGFAYQVTPKFVVRGGYGMYYGAWENRGGSPSLGYNYPFQYRFTFPTPDSVSPVTFPNGTIATLENGLSSVPLTTTAVNAKGLGLQGIQFHYKPLTSLRSAGISRLSSDRTRCLSSFRLASTRKIMFHLPISLAANLTPVRSEQRTIILCRPNMNAVWRTG
jgi:hypothetical protein